MPSGSAAPNYHGVLTANQVDTVTLDRNDWDVIQIISTESASPARIDFTLNGVTPVVGGTPTGRVLPAAMCRDVVNGEGITVIKLISAGTPHYSIIGGI